MTCKMCGGSGTQRIPRRRAMAVMDAYYDDDTPMALEVETIPCPSCDGMGSPTARDRVRVIAADQSTALTFHEDADDRVMEITMHTSARLIAEKLIESGAIKVTSSVNDIERRRDTRAEVTVVMPVLGRYTFSDQLADAIEAAERRGMEKAASIARASAERFAAAVCYGPVQALAIRGVADEITRAAVFTPPKPPHRPISQTDS